MPCQEHSGSASWRGDARDVVLNRPYLEVTPKVYIQPMRALSLPIHHEGMSRASRTIAEKPF